MAIVGRNNIGKSNLLKAIRLFMEASKRLLDEDCFYHHETSKPIKIRLHFRDLSDWERAQFGAWLYDDDTLIVEREFKATDDDSYDIDTVAVVREPEPEWLKQSVISGKKIEEWWDERSLLTVDGLDFNNKLGSSRPQVGEWKEAAAEFLAAHGDDISFQEVRRRNPKGYKGVLKGALPEFILVPAVQDVADASKITKSSPFGRLINSVLRGIADEKQQILAHKIAEVERLLNRGEDRLEAISGIEDQLNDLVSDVADVDVEISMDVPKLEEVLGTANLYANDGARTPIEDKGHGLQRAMIFTILRAYAGLAASRKDNSGETPKSTIFAFEEPEIYQHPQSQRTLLSVFRKIADTGDQVLFTTHSSHFVDVSRFDEVCILRRKEIDGNYCSEPTQLRMSQMLQDLKIRKRVEATSQGIREQYANAFDSGISEGFFADKVVLVEGPSEQYTLPIYAKLLDYDFDRNNVAVVHGGGKGQLDRLLRVFAGFGIPTYLVFDGDKNSSDGESTDKTMELLNLMGYHLEDIDDLEDTITSTFSVWGRNVERVLEAEINNYESLSSEVSRQWGPVGKPLKHRYMAIQIEKKCQGEGADPQDLVPQSIRQVIEKIQTLNEPVDILAKASP